MAATYTINVVHLQGAPNFDGKQNVVTAVSFETAIVDGEYQQVTNNHISVEYNPESFTEFSSITEQQVISWIETHPAYTNIKANLDALIQNMKVPMDYGLEKPWE